MTTETQREYYSNKQTLDIIDKFNRLAVRSATLPSDALVVDYLGFAEGFKNGGITVENCRLNRHVHANQYVVFISSNLDKINDAAC